MPQDFVAGRDLTRRVYYANQPWPLKMKSVRWEHMAVEVEDQVGGEDRARFQTITNGYRVTIEAYLDSQSQALENHLANQAQDDAGGPQTPLNAGFLFKYRDLTRGAFVFDQCTLDPIDLNDAGRTERIMVTIKFRARYLRSVQAV